MPSRNKIDRQLIFNDYKKTQNATQTAQNLGIHRNTVYQALREFQGKCIDCKNQAKPGSKYCEKCLKRIAERNKSKRKEWIRKGLCVECQEPRSPLSRQYCEKHRISHLERNEKHKNNRKTHLNTLPWENHKIIRLKERYGIHAVTLWIENNGCCEACKRNYEDITIHIHHKDGNNKNNELENLAILCADCHNLYERLKNHPYKNTLFKWIELNYPGFLKLL